MSEKIYDTAIIGGGLAGLCLSIQLSKLGHSIILFEKETYPFHKVCGEYISMESFPFLENLGLPLKKIFAESEKLFERPVSISQISFLPKSRVHKGILLLGDAAGMISPLCGNGMSMAMHASKIAAINLDKFLKKEISKTALENLFSTQWEKAFSRRLKFGRWLQYLFGKVWVTNFFISLLKKKPKLSTWIIKQTHGEAF